jgi:hypothetical protein
MVKLGPDMESFDGRQPGFGYWTDGHVFAFSRTHRERRAGQVRRHFGHAGPLSSIHNINSPGTAEVNHPGYYATRLTRYNTFA